MLTDNITDEIKKAQQWHSPRYDIDKGLLEAGYEPHEIEAAWQQIQIEAHPPKPKLIDRFGLPGIIIILWLIIGLLGMGVFHLAPVIFVVIYFFGIAAINALKVKKKIK